MRKRKRKAHSVNADTRPCAGSISFSGIMALCELVLNQLPAWHAPETTEVSSHFLGFRVNGAVNPLAPSFPPLAAQIQGVCRLASVTRMTWRQRELGKVGGAESWPGSPLD